MSEKSFASNNHAREPVPESERVSGYRIAVIIIGIAITLPAFLVGAEIIASLGLRSGFYAIALAAAVLVIVASLTMLVGACTHLSTYEILHLTFGAIGSKCVNALLAFTLFGWYGITAILFGKAASGTLNNISDLSTEAAPFVIVGSILMILTTIYGFKAIDRLSRIAVPLLALLLVVAVWMVTREAGLSTLLSASPSSSTIAGIGAGASLIIGSFMVGVTIVPDMSRFSRAPKEAVKGALLSYGAGSPAVLLFAGLPVLVTGQKDLVVSMTALGLGLPALIVILFATWTTNVNNLYSASLGTAQLLVHWPDWKITITSGVLGTLLAFVVGIENFVEFLTFLSISIPPIAGIYLTDFFLLRRLKVSFAQVEHAQNWGLEAFAAWVIAVAIGAWEVSSGIILSGVTALDMVIVSGLSFYILRQLRSKIG